MSDLHSFAFRRMDASKREVAARQRNKSAGWIFFFFSHLPLAFTIPQAIAYQHNVKVVETFCVAARLAISRCLIRKRVVASAQGSTRNNLLRPREGGNGGEGAHYLPRCARARAGALFSTP